MVLVPWEPAGSGLVSGEENTLDVFRQKQPNKPALLVASRISSLLEGRDVFPFVSFIQSLRSVTWPQQRLTKSLFSEVFLSSTHSFLCVSLVFALFF